MTLQPPSWQVSHLARTTDTGPGVQVRISRRHRVSAKEKKGYLWIYCVVVGCRIINGLSLSLSPVSK